MDPTGESVTDGERKSQQRASFAETGLRTSMGIHGVFSYAKLTSPAEETDLEPSTRLRLRPPPGEQTA